MNRTFVTLAHDYRGEFIDNWLLSEKIDGMRCLWDGIGPRTEIPPYANKVKNKVTGLWTRYGNVFNAPEWFTDELPRGIMLDGELFAGDLQTTKRLKTDIPVEKVWRNAKFYAFDIVPLISFFSTGKINNPYFTKQINLSDMYKYHEQITFIRDRPFEERMMRLQQEDGNDSLRILPYRRIDNIHEAMRHFNDVVETGGEGVVVRDPKSGYHVKRTRSVLRIKMQNESTCKVVSISYEPRSLFVDWNGLKFNIGSGLKVLPLVGSTIKFKYAGLTDEGIPREARMIR